MIADIIRCFTNHSAWICIAVVGTFRILHSLYTSGMAVEVTSRVAVEDISAVAVNDTLVVAHLGVAVE